MRKILGIVVASLFVVGTAHAGPIAVEPSSATSSVTAEIVSPAKSCLLCKVDATLSGGLDDVSAMLESGQSVTFEFFDLLIGGLIGSAEIAIYATLGLGEPVGANADGTGLGGFATFLFVFNAVDLTWIQPNAIDLGDGTLLSVTFENLYEFILGNRTTVSATVSRYDAAAVPEPETAALLLIGLLALWFSSRRGGFSRSRSGLDSAAIA